MMGLSLGHILIAGVVVLLFGGRRLPELGAGLGRGLRVFKEELNGSGGTPPAEAQALPPKADPHP